LAGANGFALISFSFFSYLSTVEVDSFSGFNKYSFTYLEMELWALW